MTPLRIILIITFSLAVACHAGDAGMPGIVVGGFEAYQKYGAVSGVGAWLKGSAFEAADKDQVTAKITRVESLYGRLIGYELVREIKLTPSTRRVYVTAKFEKGVAWMFFDCYRPGVDWIVVRFDFSTKADEVIPTSILGGQ